MGRVQPYHQLTNNKQQHPQASNHIIYQQNQNVTYLGNKVQSSLSLLLLQLERNATDGATSNSLHQMGDKARNLVSHSLGGKDSNITDNSLVGVEIKSQTRIILLDDRSCGLLDGLISDTLQKYSTSEQHSTTHISAHDLP